MSHQREMAALLERNLKRSENGQRCDYDILFMPSEEEAEAMVESAEIFLELTKKYLREIGYSL